MDSADLVELFPRSIDRGSIEANRVTDVRNRSVTFRVQLIAAPLKLEALGIAPGLHTTAFRVQLIAAPLKQVNQCVFQRIRHNFPRSIDRGSIEAR